MEYSNETLDLSSKKLRKLNKPSQKEAQVTTLLLDDNELQRLDNIDSFVKLEKLSAVKNQLLRMYGVCRLHLLHTLDLSYNGILTIEGLKELVNLKKLCLAKNNIKTIEHLNTNINLEHLDLSENSITHISDLSVLNNLKELYLHNNKIGHLHQCDKFLPPSLTTLTLAFNNINDLNEISQLVNLVNLKSITLTNNPCVNMSGIKFGFDYRPFIINWCLNIQVIDGFSVDAIESLRGEWLYSQGRGRHFRIGEHEELSQYLASVCPLTGEQLETEEDRKLRLILCKAQQHQQQLREQSCDSPTPSPLSRKKLHAAKFSPRLSSSKLNIHNKSPDRMATSCYNNSNISEPTKIMSKSCDSSLFSKKVSTDENSFKGEVLKEIESITSPLQALSKFMPVPESLMSPDCGVSMTDGKIIPSNKQSKFQTLSKSQILKTEKNTASPKLISSENSKNLGIQQNPNKNIRISTCSEDESEINVSQLKRLQQKIEALENVKRTESNQNEAEDAATCIQKYWRGYYIRNKDKEVQNALKKLRSLRADQHILKLTNDIESTKAALENERKLQMLQMQAINALWKKVSNLQPDLEKKSNDNPPKSLSSYESDLVKDLAHTCSVLQSQIQQLQNSMQDIMKCMSVFSQATNVQHQLEETVATTQTEIVAVHTPQGEAGKLFPFIKQPRPSSLPLPVYNKKNSSQTENLEVKQFADNLVDDVIKTVNESKPNISECSK